MGYKLLGMLVWKGGTAYMRQRYGATYAPKSVLIGALVLVLIGVLAVARNRES